jgi:Xaa-Pro aminopeptidase
MYKSPLELDSYRIGGEAATASMNILMEGLLGGKSEQEAAGDAAREVVRRGGRIQVIGVNHGDTIGFSQRNPLAGYSADAPKRGDIVTGSIHAAFHQGYYLDPGRTAVVGRPTPDQRRLIEATVDIVAALSDRMRPGVRLLDVAAEGDRLTAEFGGAVSPSMKSFPFYGHGVGLAFELPRISTSMSLPTDSVAENMVFGVEAFLSLDKVGSAFFEDIIIIGKDGNELLTRTPNYWW